MTNRLVLILVAVVLVLAAAAPARAQKYEFVGRAKCVNCHDHDNEKLWSEKKDGPPPNNHLNALKQMETEKSTAFAAATGVKDVYDLASPCVRCHATIVKGDVSGGVTCETCHGAGSGYLEPHQKKDSYPQAVATGLVDSVKKSNNWAVMCMTCHVMDDARLIAAKHPAGDDFDLGAKFTVVATGHWKSTYDKAAITALGKAAAAKIIAARKGGTAAAPVTSAAPTPISAPPASPAAVAPANAGTPAAPASTATAAAAPSSAAVPAPAAAAPTSAAAPAPGRTDVRPAPVQNAAPAAATPSASAVATAAPTPGAAENAPPGQTTPPSAPAASGASTTDTTTAPVGTQVLVDSSTSWWVWAVIPIVVIVVGGIWYFTRRGSGKY